jgi:arylsulfatase A-like enzyme
MIHLRRILLPCLLCIPWLSVVAETRPNLLFILADDLGWADTTLYGHTSFHQTPNVERLAKRGMTFTRAYSASPLCSPTRSAILTGLSPARTGLTTPGCHLPSVVLKATPGTSANPPVKATQPKPVTRLDTGHLTLAQHLSEAGYATGHFGKWHLGPEPYSPLEHGFDVDIPHHPGPGPAGSYVAPWKFKDFDHDPDVPDQHIEDRMADEAVEWMEQVKDRPFFLNYWMFSVHAPFDAKETLVQSYRSKVDPKNPQRSPTYAAMVHSMDDAIGTLLDALERLGLDDNTIIIFSSDNGGNMYNYVDGGTPTSNAPLKGGKATMFEGGVRVPQIIAWPGVTKPGSQNDLLTQSEDFFPTLIEGLELPDPGVAFDGVSIFPALGGVEMDHPPTFTYFPHAPSVPQWLPPSVAVHDGDWKLIRLFHEGRQGAHRHLLFDLNSDLGESRNLAGDHPDKVAALDAQIESFLTATDAVQPSPNPRFDPSKYNPSRIGKAELKGKPKPKTDDAGDPLLKGWKMRNGTAAVKNGIVTITSKGTDPFLGVGAGVTGPATVRFRIRAKTSGSGSIEWIQPGTAQGTSLPFDLAGDDWEDLEIKIPAASALGIFRIHLPPAALPVNLDHVEITGSDRKRRWDF